jgi:two-component system, cell cycle sensor histidine kinase and response regulator CckA
MWRSQSQSDSKRPASVLVVDDEAAVRELESRMLMQAGYDVHVVDDAETALQWIRGDRRVDLVLADVNMPEMNGDEMARRIRALRPEMKILFVTGFSDTLFANQPVLWQDQAYLDKPFTRQGLLEAVSLLLHGRLAS